MRNSIQKVQFTQAQFLTHKQLNLLIQLPFVLIVVVLDYSMFQPVTISDVFLELGLTQQVRQYLSNALDSYDLQALTVKKVSELIDEHEEWVFKEDEKYQVEPFTSSKCDEYALLLKNACAQGLCYSTISPYLFVTC